MSFQSFGFFAFLMVTLGLTLPLAGRRPKAALWAAVLACFWFYAAGGRGLLLLLLGLGVTAGAVSLMERGTHGRTAGVLAALWHIGVLLV